MISDEGLSKMFHVKAQNNQNQKPKQIVCAFT